MLNIRPHFFGRVTSPRRHRQLRGLDDELAQGHIERVLRIGSIKSMIAVGPAEQKAGLVKVSQFFLNGMERQETETRQLPHIQFLARVREQEPKDLRSNPRKQGLK